MTDPVVKPEETVVAVGAPQPTEPPAAAADSVTAAPASDTPKADETAEKKEDAEPTKEEPKEMTQGKLSRRHGGLLSFLRNTRFFYFHDEAITEENLKTYLHKDSASKSIAAHALHTGKGLWFHCKDETHKVPHGIIKLADVTEVTESGSNKFVLKLASGDPLHFEAPAAERDSWVHTLKSKIAEAKAAADDITESDGYKAALEKLMAKPAAASKAVAKTEESKDDKAEEAKPDAAAEPAAPSEEEASASETKADVKRSASRKKIPFNPASLFGGRKEKPEEKQEDEVAADKPADAPPSDTPAAAPAATEPAVAAAADAKPAEDEDAKPAENAKPVEDAKSAEAAHSKRRSFFSFGVKKGPEAEDDAKQSETAAAAAEGASGETKSPSSPRTDGILSFLKRDRSPPPKAAAAEAPATAVPEETAEASPEVKDNAPATEPSTAAGGATPATDAAAAADAPKDAAAPAAEEITPAETSTAAAATTTTTPPATTAPAKETAVSPREKRKSVFNFGKGGKSEKAKPDPEDAEAPKPSTSPVSKGLFGNLKRAVSKAGRSSEKAEHKEVAAPAPVAEEGTAAPATAEPIKASDAKPEDKAPEAAPAIGDVVPEAVTVGAQPVQAAA